MPAVRVRVCYVQYKNVLGEALAQRIVPILRKLQKPKGSKELATKFYRTFCSCFEGDTWVLCMHVGEAKKLVQAALTEYYEAVGKRCRKKMKPLEQAKVLQEKGASEKEVEDDPFGVAELQGSYARELRQHDCHGKKRPVLAKLKDRFVKHHLFQDGTMKPAVANMQVSAHLRNMCDLCAVRVVLVPLVRCAN